MKKLISYPTFCILDIFFKYTGGKNLKSGGKIPVSDIKLLDFVTRLCFCNFLHQHFYSIDPLHEIGVPERSHEVLFQKSYVLWDFELPLLNHSATTLLTRTNFEPYFVTTSQPAYSKSSLNLTPRNFLFRN